MIGDYEIVDIQKTGTNNTLDLVCLFFQHEGAPTAYRFTAAGHFALRR